MKTEKENIEKSEEDVIELKKEGDLWIWEYQGKRYGFRKWTWGEKNKITYLSSRLMPDGQKEFDPALFNINMLLATLREAPFPITKESLENQDPLIVDQLLAITMELNLVKPKKIQNL